MELIKNALFKIGCWIIGAIAIIVICIAMIIGLAALGVLAPILVLVVPLTPLKDLISKDKDSQLITD